MKSNGVKRRRHRGTRQLQKAKNRRQKGIIRNQGNEIGELTDQVVMLIKTVNQLTDLIPEDMWAITLTKVDAEVAVVLKSL